MDQPNYYNDWDNGVYGTGPTKPPKSHGGLIALLLILIIFLCGVITLLGLLNVKLFQKLQLREDHDLGISFTVGQTQPEAGDPDALTDNAPSDNPPSDSISLQETPKSMDNIPDPNGLSLQDIYIQSIPSVVSISCVNYNGSSTGTGVVLTQDGYLITNAHVVENATSISVQLTDNRVFPAQILGFDEISDLAVLWIDAEDLTPARFGDSNALRVGDTVVAIGDPLGVEFRGTYTDGIVSAINRDVDMEGHTMTLIQTNAALNSGNSGGPLINCYGQVIGINTMKIGTFTDSAGVEGLGFAIPSATVRDIVNQLLNQGYVSGRPTLGLTGDSLSVFYQHYYHLPAGLYITDVDPDSDAWQKGIVDGDILLSVGDIRITTMSELKASLNGRSVGETVSVVIYRGGQQYQVELELTEDKG